MSYSSLSAGRRRVIGVMVDNYEWTPLPGWSGHLEPEFRIDETLASSIQSISSDSRQVSPGTLFIAVRGENYDGHDFINDAVERGAIGVVSRSGTLTYEAVAQTTAVGPVSYTHLTLPTILLV